MPRTGTPVATPRRTATVIRAVRPYHGQAMPDLQSPRSLPCRGREGRQPLPAGQDDAQGGRQVPEEGIFTLTQLSYVYRPRRRSKKSLGQIPTPFNVELQALAIREKKIYLHERPTLAQQPVELFLDIEGIPDQDFNYLVGLMVKKGDKTTMRWARSSPR